MPHVWKTASTKLANLLAASLNKLSRGEVESLGRHVYGQYRTRSGEAAMLFCKTIVDLSNAAPNNLFENGEAWLLRQVTGLGFKVLFDVGANKGDWVNYAVGLFPDAQIHCFEIVPTTFEKLKSGLVPNTAQVTLNAFGLSDEAGQIEVFVGDSDYISSMYAFTYSDRTKHVMCDVRRGDVYAREQGLQRIDMVKIDTEGADGNVMRGLSELLDKKAIRLVQFEYNRGAIESRFLLQDFYKFLEPRGYVLGKLIGDGVRFHEYEYAYEDFNGPNYVACLADDKELIAAISAR